MISVIIPALNEEKTIGKVVQTAFEHPDVSEVIVVDDQSADNTVTIAILAGATVLISKKRGKGFSMKEGVIAAKNEAIVFLDADIDPYPEQTVGNLARPILEGKADFIKGSFARNAGRVTLLVAKPLLSVFYPGLSHFNQPLSGMIAGKRSYFMRMDFFNDYGVDIGILIDMYLMKARILEVNIGYIENKSKQWTALGKMSEEVCRAIITRAQRHIPETTEEDIEQISFIQQKMHTAIDAKLSEYNKLAVFDMDNTILQGRFIDTCARFHGFESQLQQLRENESDPIILTKRIGLLLKGRSIDELLDVAESIPLVPDIIEVAAELKRNGYMIGIISNSYMLITNMIGQKLQADFTMANKLEYFGGKATGEVNLPSCFFAAAEPVCKHSYCKTHALQHACSKYKVDLKNCIAVGDSMDDRCMITHAGKGLSFNATDEQLIKSATFNISKNSFKDVLSFV